MKTQSPTPAAHAQHTPTPWKWTGTKQSPHLNAYLQVGDSYVLFVPEGVDEANAAFIVEACNAHAALVAENARLTRSLQTALFVARGGADECNRVQICDILQAALRDGQI